MAQTAAADEVTLASGITGNAVENLKKIVAPWEEGHRSHSDAGADATIHHRPIWPVPLVARGRQCKDIDLYQTDVIWAPQLADQFVDLSERGR